MEISLVLTNDSGSYQAILGQFIATAIAETAADRAAADADAASALASATSAAASATSATNSASTASTQAGIATTQAGNAATSATAASGSASAASTSAGNASTSATNAANSATAAAGSASAAATSASNAAATLANALVKANNLSDVANATTARGNLSAAKSGANSDITGLSGLTTALSVAQGGTGATSQAAALSALLGASLIPIANGGTNASSVAAARSNLGAAASGANSDITSLSGLTTALSVTQGGTGANTAAAARTNLGAAASGTNGDVTSLTGLTGGITVPPSNALPFTVGGAERARIDINGSLHIGETAAWSSGALSARNFSAQPWAVSAYAAYQSAGGCFLGRVDTTATNIAAWFFGSTNVGTISTNGTGTTYGTTSDYRLKQNVVDLSGDDAVAMIRAGRPVRYTFISDDTNAPHIGFIADAYQAIQPEAVTGVKDDMGISMTPRFDDDGNIILDANGSPIYDTVPRYQTLDYGKPTPILWAALNRALDRLDAAEAEIAALKAKTGS